MGIRKGALTKIMPLSYRFEVPLAISLSERENIGQMKIGVLGLWHTGEVFSACLADLGNKVIGIDENNRIVNNLNKGIPPLADPFLEEINIHLS